MRILTTMLLVQIFLVSFSPLATYAAQERGYAQSSYYSESSYQTPPDDGSRYSQSSYANTDPIGSSPSWDDVVNFNNDYSQGTYANSNSNNNGYQGIIYGEASYSTSGSGNSSGNGLSWDDVVNFSNNYAQATYDPAVRRAELAQRSTGKKIIDGITGSVNALGIGAEYTNPTYARTIEVSPTENASYAEYETYLQSLGIAPAERRELMRNYVFQEVNDSVQTAKTKDIETQHALSNFVSDFDQTAAAFAVANKLSDETAEVTSEAEINALFAAHYAEQGNLELAQAYATVAEYQAEVASYNAETIQALDDFIVYTPMLTGDENTGFDILSPDRAIKLAGAGITEKEATLAHAVLLGLKTNKIQAYTNTDVKAVARMFAGELDATTRQHLIDGTATSDDLTRAAQILATAINRAGSRGTSISEQIYRPSQYSFWNPSYREQFSQYYEEDADALDTIAEDFLSGKIANNYTNIDELLPIPDANSYFNPDATDKNGNKIKPAWATSANTLGYIEGYHSYDGHLFIKLDGEYDIPNLEIAEYYPQVETALDTVNAFANADTVVEDSILMGYLDGGFSITLDNGGTGITFNAHLSSNDRSNLPSDRLSGEQTRKKLAQYGITFNKAESDTSGEGMYSRTSDEVVVLQQECGCDIVVTGGTEEGHAGGDFSHKNGYKVDLRSHNPATGEETGLTEYIKSNFIQSDKRSDGATIYLNPERPNVTYYLEGNHWDIRVLPTDGEQQPQTKLAEISTDNEGNTTKKEKSTSFTTSDPNPSPKENVAKTIQEITDSVIPGLGETLGNAAAELLFADSNSGGIAGILSSIFSGVGKIFGGATSPKNNSNSSETTSNNNYQEHPLADTSSQYSQADYASGDGYNPINDAVESDLTVRALKAESSVTDEYRFSGSISRILTNGDDDLSFSEIRDKFASTIEGRLELDLDCDDTVDNTTTFVVPYRSILPRSEGTDYLISEYLPVPTKGLHCFAFEVDINNDITETNESNNKSVWKEFVTDFNIATEDDIDSSIVLPSFILEAQVSNANDEVISPWSTQDLTINEGEQLAFRWDASIDYESCLPFIYPVNYSFTGDLFTTKRDTYAENIEVRELTKEYSVECRIGDMVRVESINITAPTP